MAVRAQDRHITQTQRGVVMAIILYLGLSQQLVAVVAVQILLHSPCLVARAAVLVCVA